MHSWKKLIQKRPLLFLCLGFCLFLLSGLSEFIFPSELDHNWEQLARSERCLLRLRGQILEKRLSLRRRNETLFLFSSESWIEQTQESALQGKLWLRLDSSTDSIRTGDRIEVLGRYRHSSSATNPGQPDRSLRDREQQIAGSLSTSPGNVRVLNRPILCVRQVIEFVRESLLNRLRKLLSTNALSIAAPLLLGIWDPGFQKVTQLFENTGTIHLLAVSGLQVVLLFTPLFRLFWKLRWPSSLKLSILALCLLVYACLTGLQPPVLRACAMLLLYFTAISFRRIPDALSILAASAYGVIVLKWDEVPRPSFQLSFLAVFALIVFAPRVLETLRTFVPESFVQKRPVNTALNSVAMSIAAFCLTFPVVVFHFGFISWACIPATIVLTPIIPLLMVTGYFLALLPVLAGVLAPVFELGTQLTIWGLERFDALPGTPQCLAGLTGIAISLLVLAFLSLLSKLSKWISIFTLGAGLILFLLPDSRVERLKLTVLDVGHGNAIVIQLPTGENLLFDAGSLDKPNLARGILFPFFQTQSITAIELFILSHSDWDHCSALRELDSKIVIQELICGSGVAQEIRPLFSGDVSEVSGRWLRHYGSASIEVLRANPGLGSADNDLSLCARIRYQDRTILLCGDLEEEGVRALLESEDDLRAEILLLPHHGLPNEETINLLDRVNPGWILVSCGRTFRLEGELPVFESSRVLSTLRDGALQLSVESDGSILVTSPD